MCHKLACLITDFLLCKKLIEDEESEIYKYGYDLLIYTAGQILLLCVLGALIKQKLSTIVYIIVFVSLRQYVGGYHASSRVRCTVMTVMSYMVVMGLVIIVDKWWQSPMIFASTSILSICIIVRYAPIENENKPLSRIQIQKNRKKGVILSILYIIVALLVHLISRRVSNSIIFSEMAVAVLMIIQKKGGKTDEENF